jgi:hypothetical protein
MVTQALGYRNEYASSLGSAHRIALRIAAKGRPVFPCKADKSPCTPRGFKDASADPARVTALWNSHGGEKVGMPTGERSGVFVVDVDRLEALGELPQELPETLTVRTPSGGLHYYLNHVPGITNRRGTLPPGIDIRGDGGYVIAPPSEGYVVERRAPVADAPDWLMEALREQPRHGDGVRNPGRGSASAADASEAGPIPDGQRNQTLTGIAGRLHDGTRDLGQLEDDLLAVNDARCAPPLPAAEVRRVAASVHRYEPCRPGRREPDPETVAALAGFERDMFAREWKGKGGKTKYSIAVAALKLARQHGRRSPAGDGVELDISHRQWALAAACSRSSIVRALKAMTDVFRQDNEGAGEGKAGTIVLLCQGAPIDTTLPTGSLIGEKQGGCVSWRAPLTAPRRRWSSPRFKRRRGVTPGTSRVRTGPAPKKRDGVGRIGKGTEPVVDTLEASGGTMALADLAAAVGVKRPRDLTRRKDPRTGKGRDGYVTRLEDAGIVRVSGCSVSFAGDWLDALDHDREASGEMDLYRRDMSKYNHDREAYRNRHETEASVSPAPTEEEMGELREGYPERRRRAVEDAIARLFRERPEYRERRVGQITCRLIFHLPEDFPRGDLGPPKDAEVEEILEQNGAAA